MPDFAGLNDRMKAAMEKFQAAFPGINITSGHRDTAHNAAVGGAKGSQHIGGNALDLGFAGVDPKIQEQALKWWKDEGAGGFGYYPKSTSAHVDFGAPRAWGPNYSRTSLNQTPDFFQRLVGGLTPASPNRPVGMPIEGGGPPVMSGMTPPGMTLNSAAVQGPPAPPPENPLGLKHDLSSLKGWSGALGDASGGLSKIAGAIGGGGGEDKASAALNTIDPMSGGAGMDGQLAALRTAAAPMLMQLMGARDRTANVRRPMGMSLGMGV